MKNDKHNKFYLIKNQLNCANNLDDDKNQFLNANNQNIFNLNLIDGITTLMSIT